MILDDSAEAFRRSSSDHVAIGAFNVIGIESIEAIIQAAELTRQPVLLQMSQNCVRYHGALKPIAAAMRSAAEMATVPVGIHLDHADEVDLVEEALDLGFTSVMIDGSALEFDANVELTRWTVSRAHAQGVPVEAELGMIGGKGAHAPGVRTDPAEAAQFVERTGVDLLAVAVGSEHAMRSRTATLDIQLIERIAQAVDIPLVLHGSSGVNDATLARAVRAGIAKVNIATHLGGMFTRGLEAALQADPSVTDPRKYLGPARDTMTAETARIIRLLSQLAPTGGVEEV